MKTVLALLLVSGIALASVQVTTGPVFAPDGTKHTNLDKCIAHVSATLGAEPALCVRTTTVLGVCDEATEPELPLETDAIATQCPNDDTRWYLRAQGWKRGSYPACGWDLVMLPEGTPAFCTDPQPSMYDPSPDDAPEAPIDPEFDEHSPEGPGPGPEGALPVDKPRTPPVTTGETTP